MNAPRYGNAANSHIRPEDAERGDTKMQEGKGGMGSHKHGTSGHSSKSPKLKHRMKREAEKDVRLDRARIKDPKTSVQELFRKKP
jgi:hypothetical protein